MCKAKDENCKTVLTGTKQDHLKTGIPENIIRHQTVYVYELRNFAA